MEACIGMQVHREAVHANKNALQGSTNALGKSQTLSSWRADDASDGLRTL